LSKDYSKTPLAKKLGIKANQRIAILCASNDYVRTVSLPGRVSVGHRLTKDMDYVQIFEKSKTKLEKDLIRAKKAIKPSGAIWVSWPKQSSHLKTDLDGNIVREIGLKSGLVDVKICAIDENWSGLKFVFRLKDRLGKSQKVPTSTS
jgi:hypothetical protein